MNVRLRLRFFSLAVLMLTHTKVAPNTTCHITPPPLATATNIHPASQHTQIFKMDANPPPLPDAAASSSSTKKAQKPLVALLKEGKITDLRSIVAAYLYSEMKTGTKGMSIAAQSDWMFKKYHGFQHPGEDTPARTNKVHYDSIKTHLARVETVPAYELFLNGTQQYKECWKVGMEACGSSLHLNSDEKRSSQRKEQEA